MAENMIYCFSGTGNCLDLAKNIAKELGDTDVVMMRKAPVVTDARSYKRVGFVFPCYGGGAPKDVLEYAKQIQVSSIAYVFAVSQSASYAGTGLSALNKIHKLEYWRAVRHQCSCIWLFPHDMMVPPLGVKFAQKQSERVAKKIAKDVREEKKKPEELNPRAIFYLGGRNVFRVFINSRTFFSFLDFAVISVPRFETLAILIPVLPSGRTPSATCNFSPHVVSDIPVLNTTL